MRNTKKKGFTIVELVIVIAVIAILAGVLIPTFTGVIENANKSAAVQNASNEWKNYCAEKAEEGFASFNGWIKSGEYYVQVVNGQVDPDSVTKTPTIADGMVTIEIAEDAYTEVMKDVVIYTEETTTAVAP